jgi:hypothetical protein
MKSERDERLGNILGEGIRRHISPGSCPSLEDIAAAVDGRLKVDEREGFLSHLASCPECRALYRHSSELLRTSPPVSSYRFIVGSLVAVAVVAVIAIRLVFFPADIGKQLSVATQQPPLPSSAPPPVSPDSQTAKSPPPVPKPAAQAPAPVLVAQLEKGDAFWARAFQEEPEERPSLRTRDLQSSEEEEGEGAPVDYFRAGIALQLVRQAVAAGDAHLVATRLGIAAAALEGASPTDGERLHVLIGDLEKSAGTKTQSDRVRQVITRLEQGPTGKYVLLGEWAEEARAWTEGVDASASPVVSGADRLVASGFTKPLASVISETRMLANARSTDARKRAADQLRTLPKLLSHAEGSL